MALKIYAKLKGKLTCAFENDWRIWQIFLYRLKNNNSILKSKMEELNQNKNSKQPDQPDSVWKVYFT